MRFLNNKPLPIGVQVACMQERFPQFKYYRLQKAWIGTLQPTKTSYVYKIKLSYELYRVPHVTVLKPRLVENAPHMYRSKGTLCLYFPYDNSWTYRKLIAQTIVPWTAEWLYYYELWLSTGQWYGPEAPHDVYKV